MKKFKLKFFFGIWLFLIALFVFGRFFKILFIPIEPYFPVIFIFLGVFLNIYALRLDKHLKKYHLSKWEEFYTPVGNFKGIKQVHQIAGIKFVFSKDYLADPDLLVLKNACKFFTIMILLHFITMIIIAGNLGKISK